MSEFSTPLPSGLRVRHIQTTSAVVNGKTVVTPALDGQGKEIELYAVVVPLTIEAIEGSAAVRKATVEGFVADMRGGKAPEVALVRASAVAKGTDPVAAETAFATAQLAGNVAAEAALGDALATPPIQIVQPGGLS